VVVPPCASAQTASVHGTVFHEEGKRATEAVVQLRGTPAPAPADPNVTQKPATPEPIALAQRVKPDGSFEFAGLAPGTYELHADAATTDPGRTARSRAFVLEKTALERNLVLGPAAPRVRAILGTLGSVRCSARWRRGSVSCCSSDSRT
jgi:hypothetical protein